MSEPPLSSTEIPDGLDFFRVWFFVGLQSFGGGMATLALVRRAVVDHEKYLTEAEFSRFWSLVQLAPGTNLLALTILIGRRVAGWKGICLALAGLLLPSVLATIALTAGYAHVRQSPWVQAALSGVVPAIVGLALVTAWQIAHPLLANGDRAGWGKSAWNLLLLVGSAVLAWRGHFPVIALLGGAALLSAAWNWGRHQTRRRNE